MMARALGHCAGGVPFEKPIRRSASNRSPELRALRSSAIAGTYKLQELKAFAMDRRNGKTEQAAAQPSLTVWFDGACPLCRREIDLFRKLDRRRAIHFEDVSLPDASCPLDPAQLLARFHAQERGQPVVSGAAAFAAMWRAIPVLRPIGELARIPALLWLLERLYTVFLRFRPKLQKLAGRRTALR